MFFGIFLADSFFRSRRMFLAMIGTKFHCDSVCSCVKHEHYLAFLYGRLQWDI